MNKIKKEYVTPQMQSMAALLSDLMAGSVKSDDEPIGQDPTPGTGDDQAGRDFGNYSVWDED